MVSAALVAHREVEEAESEQGPTDPDKDQDRREHDSEGDPKDTEKEVSGVAPSVLRQLLATRS